MINSAEAKHTQREKEREKEKPKVRWSGNDGVIIYVKNYGLHHDPPVAFILRMLHPPVNYD